MKLISILTISLVFLLGSCVDPKGRATIANPHRMELDNTSQYYDQNYKVYTLEGCEYIVVGVGKTQWGSHKGNCKNPIHKYESTNN
jgi:hypothetical protein